jgi:hypothetical protein
VGVGEPSSRLMWELRGEHFQEIYLKGKMKSKCKTWVKARNVYVIIINISLALSQIWNPRSTLQGPGQCSQYSNLLWAWQFRVWNPVGGKRPSLFHTVQTGPGAHPSSCTMGTGGGSFPVHGNDHLPHLESRLRMSRVIPLIALYFA